MGPQAGNRASRATVARLRCVGTPRPGRPARVGRHELQCNGATAWAGPRRPELQRLCCIAPARIRKAGPYDGAAHRTSPANSDPSRRTRLSEPTAQQLRTDRELVPQRLAPAAFIDPSYEQKSLPLEEPRGRLRLMADPPDKTAPSRSTRTRGLLSPISRAATHEAERGRGIWGNLDADDRHPMRPYLSCEPGWGLPDRGRISRLSRRPSEAAAGARRPAI